MIKDLGTLGTEADLHGESPDVLIERALILDSGAPRTLAFLLHLLHFQGYFADVVADIDVDAAAASGDGLLVRNAAAVLADLERDADVARLIDKYAKRSSLTPVLRQLLAGALLRLGKPERAVETLGDDAEGGSAIMRAMCLRRLGRTAQSRAVLSTTRAVASQANDQRLAAWATFLLGDVQGALDGYARWLGLPAVTGKDADLRTYEAVFTSDVARLDPSIQFDVAQMYLLRGRAGDVERASTLLDEAIAVSTVVTDLVNARTIELPMLTDLLRGSTHERAARAVVAKAEDSVSARSRVLRDRSREAGTLGSRLAAARRQLASEEAVDAFALYGKLLAADGPPESAEGVNAAAGALRVKADQAMERGAAHDALAGWRAISELFDAHAPDVRGLERQRVAARLALTELDTGVLDASVAHFAATDGERLLEALPMFVRDVASAWRLYDGLQKLAATDGRNQALADVADRLPLDRIYGLSSERSDVTALTVETAIGIDFGASTYLRDSDEMAARFHQLRDEVNQAMGVRFPGAQVRVREDLTGVLVRLSFYGDVAADVPPPDRDVGIVETTLWGR